jgi:hypothetical protein
MAHPLVFADSVMCSSLSHDDSDNEPQVAEHPSTRQDNPAFVILPTVSISDLTHPMSNSSIAK